VAATRNHLLDRMKGDWVLFVDADDWIELDMVEYLVNLAQSHSADFVMCDRVINDVEPSHAEPRVFELDQEHAIEDFLHHDYFIGSLCNKIIKSHCLQNERFQTDISYGEDALFCWGVLQKTQKVVVSSKQLYHYRMNEESISHQTFGEKKLTGHQTWTFISEDVKKRWPQYKELVLGTFARSDMYLLQQASIGGYPKDDNIKDLQRNVRKNYRYLVPRLKNTKTILMMATIIMYWYGFGRVYYAFHKIKTIR
jgi:glycosyltransferase involved in cell wall biosynthesis